MSLKIAAFCFKDARSVFQHFADTSGEEEEAGVQELRYDIGVENQRIDSP